jgi:hypothetical protein
MFFKILGKLITIEDVEGGFNPSATVKRSPQWTTTRNNHLKLQPQCYICNGVRLLNVHHITPFHMDPSRELDPTNLVTLCEKGPGGVNCHLTFGHLGYWARYNPDILKDALVIKAILEKRP